MIVLLLTSLIYYTAFSRRTDALVVSQSREINKQIVLNYKSYISSVIETANYVQSASLNLDVIDSYKELQDIYSFSTDIKKGCGFHLSFQQQRGQNPGKRYDPQG